MVLKTKLAIGLAGLLVCGSSAGFLIACGDNGDEQPTELEAPASGNVEYVIPEDGTTPLDHSAYENIGYMSYRLKNQTNWYSEMHGAVDTMVNQTVDTYKQFSDGVLISTELSKSSLVKTAKQMCYVGDHVLWREAAVGADEWDGVNTQWKTDEPVHITAEDYLKTYGLPGTEFAVYVLNEDTILSADDVIDHGDGTYSQTYYLNPEGDKAPYYYRQQMMMTGGLDEWPVFDNITVTYTFDSTWQVLRSEISESYHAKMVVSVGCTATYSTVYEYNTDKALSGEFDAYYGNYADKPAETPPPAEPDPTAASCLTQGFSTVLNGGETFDLSLDLNGKQITGVVFADATDMSALRIRAKLENIDLWMEGDDVFLSYGNANVKLSVAELTELLAEILPEDSMSGMADIDTDAMMDQLGAGEFAWDEEKASIAATLEILGLTLPIQFEFAMADGTASFASVSTEVALSEEFVLKASLLPSEQELPALTEEEKQSFADLVPYAETLYELFTQDVLKATVLYDSDQISVTGTVSVNTKELAVTGAVAVLFPINGQNIAKQLFFGYEEDVLYVDLDGIRVSGSTEDILALVGEYIGGAEIEEESSFDLMQLIGTVLSEEFAQLIAITEEENTLGIALKGTELLQAFGLEFELGDALLTVSEGTLTADVLGVSLTLTAGTAFDVDTENYADVVKYIGALIDLFSAQTFRAELAYGTVGEKGIAVSGEILVDVKSFGVWADLVLTYTSEAGESAQKRISVLYENEGTDLYLTVYGTENINIKVNLAEAVEFLGSVLTIPETDVDTAALLTNLLSLRFGDYLAVTEQDALTLTVKGTELLQALGTELALGDVVLTFNGTAVTIQALGAEISLAKTESALPVLTEEEKAQYINPIPYAESLYTLFTQQVLSAEFSYTGNGIVLEGVVNIEPSTLRIAGEITLTATVEGTQIVKVIAFGYEEDVVYAALDGIKICGSTEDIAALVSEYLGEDLTSDADVDIDSLIVTLLSDEVASLFALTEEENALTLCVKGTELLQAFGMQFELGEVALTVTESALTANVLGASLTLTAGEEFSVDTANYADVVKYIGSIVDLVTAKAFRADLSYGVVGEAGIAVSGTVYFDVDTLTVIADVLLSYTAESGESAEAKVTVAYGEDGYVYLTVGGAKLKLNAEETISVLGNVLEIPETDGATEGMLAKLLSLSFGDYLTVTDEANTLTLTVKGTELLQVLGADFSLGDVVLSFNGAALNVKALGASILLQGTDTVPAIGEGFVDVTGIPAAVVDMIAAQQITFGGAVDITLGGADNKTTVSLEISKGYIGWKDGIRVYLEATLLALGTEHDLIIDANGESIRVTYGAVGAELVYEELSTLEQVFVAAYNRVAAVINEIAGKTSLEQIETLNDLLTLLGAGEALSGATSGLTESDLIGAVNGITLSGPSKQHPDSVLTVTYGKLELVLLNAQEDGSLEVFLGLGEGEIAVSANVFAKAYSEEIPVLEGEFLTAEDFAEMIDYLGAAAESLTVDSATLAFNATVTSAEEAYAETEGIKYAINAQIDYSSGGNFPIHVDTENTDLWVDPDLYAHIKINVAAANTADSSFFCELTVFDSNGDDTLEVWFSLSCFAEGTEGFAPVKLYIPMNELMTTVSAVAAVMGLDVEFLNTALLEKWLSVETTEQLRALGESLKLSFGLNEMLESLTGGAELSLGENTASATDAVVGLFNKVAVVKAAEGTDASLSILLNSDMIYGTEMAEDLSIVISKGVRTVTVGEETAERGFISGISLSNVYFDGTGTEKIDLALSVTMGCADAVAPSLDGYYNATGIGALIKTLAKSTTHTEAVEGEVVSGEEQEHVYKLNRNFYIDGSATLNALGIASASVDVVALSVTVDEDGKIGVNIRLEYQGVQELNQILINGDTVIDITIKEGMVYMKRVQSSYWQSGLLTTDEAFYEKPIVIYRAMPLSHFGSDILNQMSFMLNFGSAISSMLPSEEESTSTESAPGDYGTEASKFLTSYSYAQSASGNSWTVVLNGGALTDDVLGDITIVLTADANGVLRGLSADCPKVGIENVTLSATLTYRNPCNIMDAGVTDVTNDVAQEAADKMSQKLTNVDWAVTEYVEGGITTVTYMFNGTVVGTQEVVYDPTTGECFAQLVYPAVEGTEVGYTPTWKAPSKIEGSGTTVYASYTPNVYTVTLYSDREAEGCVFDSERGLWKLVLSYTYDTELALPVGYTLDREYAIVDFKDANGTSYSQVHNITADLELTAVWDLIEYKVTYVVNGQTFYQQKAHYGDAYELPQAPEKAGYEFIGWGVSESDSISGDTTLTAQYAAKTYTVTLVSEYALDGFELSDGVYTKTVSYEYGSAVTLPSGIRHEDTYYLDGFVRAGDDKVYTSVPTITEDTVFTASWSEIGYEITFVDENGNTVATQNYVSGATLTNLPEVPAKTGYTGYWVIVDGYTVTGEDTVSCAYTANSYQITVYSDHAADGFSASGSRYFYHYTYTYGTVWTLPTDPDIAGYDFGGYTDGNGNTVTQIANVTEDTAVYLVWIDNTITVTLCSDISFDGCSYSAKNSYYKTVKFNDVYTFSETVACPSGYKQFGWWAQVNGAWTVVTDVKAQNLNGAQIWAVWISDDLTVTINSVSTPSSVWAISGSYTGGSWYGTMSTEIAKSVGISATEEVLYVVYYSSFISSGTDKLNNGNWQNDGSCDGSFEKSGMTSFMGLSGKKGGAKVRITYTYGGMSVTVESADYAWKDK